MKAFMNIGRTNTAARRWLGTEPNDNWDYDHYPKGSGKSAKHALEERGIEIIEVDIFQEKGRESIKDRYEEGDFFLGRFSEYKYPSWVKPYHEVAHLFGENIFPNAREVYYYNDKNRQRELLEQKNYPHPKSIYATSESDVLELDMSFPVVMKGPAGSSGKYVSLWDGRGAIKFPCILQEFCSGNDGDIRTVVIGDYITGYKRLNRKGDFRASGSGKFSFLGGGLEDIPLECLETSYRISEENNFNCMCYDFVKDDSGRWVLLEFSYTFGLKKAAACYGHTYNAAKNFEKSISEWSVQELVIKRLLS